MPTALITGTSTGLGREIALALARAGYDLAITELPAISLDALLQHPDFAGRKIVPVPLDLRDEDGIRCAWDQAAAGLGDIELLVNSAARALIKPAVDVSWAEWDDVIDTNLKGAFVMSQHFARRCIARGRPGSIVSISSTHGQTGLAGRAVYGIAKGGINQMTRMLAVEWAGHDIRVNAVAPTTVMTPSRQEMLSDPVRRGQMLDRIPLGRFPDPDEIAAAVIYLASPAAASITGHVLLLDGGLTAV